MSNIVCQIPNVSNVQVTVPINREFLEVQKRFFDKDDYDSFKRSVIRNCISTWKNRNGFEGKLYPVKVPEEFLQSVWRNR